jgi:hypothetical protein
VPISASLQATIAIHPTGNEPSTRRSQNCLKQKTKWKMNSFVFRYTQLLLYIDLELNWWIYYNDLEKIKACFFLFNYLSNFIWKKLIIFNLFFLTDLFL